MLLFFGPCLNLRGELINGVCPDTGGLHMPLTAVAYRIVQAICLSHLSRQRSFAPTHTYTAGWWQGSQRATAVHKTANTCASDRMCSRCGQDVTSLILLKARHWQQSQLQQWGGPCGPWDWPRSSSQCPDPVYAGQWMSGMARQLAHHCLLGNDSNSQRLTSTTSPNTTCLLSACMHEITLSGQL